MKELSSQVQHITCSNLRKMLINVDDLGAQSQALITCFSEIDRSIVEKCSNPRTKPGETQQTYMAMVSFKSSIFNSAVTVDGESLQRNLRYKFTK